MAAARFQVVSLSRSARVPTPREPTSKESLPDLPAPRTRGFIWRFMSATDEIVNREHSARWDLFSDPFLSAAAV